MEVDLAVLADAANRSDNGKLNILGVFDSLTLGPDFPAHSPTFAIVVRVVLHRTELGEHRFELRVADADGREISKLDGTFDVKRKKSDPRPVRAAIVLQAQVNFPAPGDYTFDILLDGRWEQAIPLRVLRSEG